MFRFIVCFALFSLVSLFSSAQTIRDNPEGSLNNTHPYSQAKTVHSAQKADSTISIVRLRVPRKAWQLLKKAAQAMARNALDDAKRNLDKALKVAPAFPDALAFYGGIHANQQEWDSAEENLLAAIHSDPTFSTPYVMLSGVYNAEARFAEAEETEQQALSAGADTWDLQYEIARSLIGEKQYANALSVADTALRSEHGSLLHIARAHALTGLRRYPEATAELRSYLRDDPSGDGAADAHKLLAQLERIGVR